MKLTGYKVLPAIIILAFLALIAKDVLGKNYSLATIPLSVFLYLLLVTCVIASLFFARELRLAGVREISERKTTEQKLKKSERDFQLLVNHVKDYAIFLIDKEGRIASWNNGAEAIKGYTADEAIGQPIDIFYKADDLHKCEPQKNLEIALQNGRYETEGWRVRKDGSSFLANVVFTALKDDTGDLYGYLKITRDITRQKILQQQINYLASIVEQSSEAIISRGMDKRIISWNTGAEKMFGVPREEAIGHTGADIGFIRLTAGQMTEIEEQVSLNGTWQTEMDYFHKDGSSFFGAVTVNAIRNDSGVINALSFIIKDISLRRKLEEQLKNANEGLEEKVRARTDQIIKSEKQFRETLNNMMEGIQIHDFDWRYIYVNDALASFSRSTKEKLLGHSLLDVYPGIEQTPLFKTLDHCMRERVAEHMETEFVFPDGTNAFFELSIQPVPEGLFILSIDITKRKGAEEKLIRSEENYRTMMERVSDGFVAIDKNWCYTYVNNKAGELMNRKPAELVGKNIWEEFPEGVGQPFYKSYHNALEKQQYLHLEEYYSPFNSWLENHIYPSPEGLSIFFRDITARKQAEQKIIQSEENLKAIFENSSEGFILLDEYNRVKAFNNSVAQSIFIHPDHPDMTGRSILDFVEDSRFDFFEKILTRVLKGNTVQYDRAYENPNGATTWINFSFNPVRKGSHIKGLCITSRDITEKKLAEQQREFDHSNLHALINNTRDLMWSVDRKFNLITSNQAFDEMIRIISGQKIGKGENILMAALGQEQMKRYKKYYERAFAGESFSEIEYNSSPVEFWSEISFYPIYEKKVVIGTACFSRNITDQKRAEQLLKKSFAEKQSLAERVSSILNTLPANIALLDKKGIIIDVNDSWRTFADDNGFIGSNYGIGDNYIEISTSVTGENKTDGSSVARGIKSVLQHRSDEFVYEYACHSPGNKRWFRMVVTPLLQKDHSGVVVMHIDISELRKLEHERLESKLEEQKKITRAMLSAQQKERVAIGSELHDNVNQILVGTNLLLSMVKKRPDQGEHLIDTSINNLQLAIRENRKIAHEFVGPDLEIATLAEQLHRLSETMLKTSGIETYFNLKKFHEELLDNEKKLNIYRIAQEQCTNIVKHAKATIVSITLITTGNLFTMIIADNGKGMVYNEKTGGIGLRNINDRLSIYNGTTTICTSPGKGFSLEITIPIKYEVRN